MCGQYCCHSLGLGFNKEMDCVGQKTRKKLGPKCSGRTKKKRLLLIICKSHGNILLECLVVAKKDKKQVETLPRSSGYLTIDQVFIYNLDKSLANAPS